MFYLNYVYCFKYVQQLILMHKNYSVWFTNPTNGSSVYGDVINNSQSNIHLTFSWSGQKANPQNIWKFYIFRDFLTGSGQSYYDVWTDENNPSCYLPGYLGGENHYVIKMYEQDYPGHLIQRATQTIIVSIQQTVYVANNFNTGYVSVNSGNAPSGSVFYLTLGNHLSLYPIDNQTDNEGYTQSLDFYWLCT